MSKHRLENEALGEVLALETAFSLCNAARVARGTRRAVTERAAPSCPSVSAALHHCQGNHTAASPPFFFFFLMSVCV